MQGLANTNIGGFYDVVRAGQGAAKGAKLVTAVRTRFNQMHLVKWRVSCIAPAITQTFKLVFTNTSTPVVGDSTFKEVPMGIDPTAWPLDINVDYTQKMAARDPIEPGGKFTIYGDFCWGGEKNRAEVYFISAGTQPPASIAGTDLEAAKRTQQQLIASGLRGTPIQSSDRDVVFEAPDKDKMLSGSGDAATARLVVFDNKANRASGVTATTILTLRAREVDPMAHDRGGRFRLGGHRAAHGGRLPRRGRQKARLGRLCPSTDCRRRCTVRAGALVSGVSGVSRALFPGPLCSRAPSVSLCAGRVSLCCGAAR